MGRVLDRSAQPLHETRRWRTAKTGCRKGVIGGATARLTRVMLARNRLSLSAWFGRQEASLDTAFDVQSLRFSFELADDAYVCVLVDRGGEHFDHLTGFRLSRRTDLPSVFLTTGAKRLFERIEPIAVQPGGGWHVGELEFEGTTCRLSVDGSPVAEATVEPAARRRVGFGGGMKRVLVDDVEVRHRLADGIIATWGERFDRSDLRPRTLLVCVGLAGLLLLASCSLAWLLRRRGRKVLILAARW